MSLRKTIFWAHLAVGVTGAVVILMLAVTGVILTYEAQLNRMGACATTAPIRRPRAPSRSNSTS